MLPHKNDAEFSIPIYKSRSIKGSNWNSHTAACSSPLAENRHIYVKPHGLSDLWPFSRVGLESRHCSMYKFKNSTRLALTQLGQPKLTRRTCKIYPNFVKLAQVAQLMDHQVSKQCSIWALELYRKQKLKTKTPFFCMFCKLNSNVGHKNLNSIRQIFLVRSWWKCCGGWGRCIQRDRRHLQSPQLKRPPP